MVRPRKSYRTKIAKVPVDFHNEVTRIARKRGYKSNTEFLHKQGTVLFRNSDLLRDLTDQPHRFFRLLGKKK